MSHLVAWEAKIKVRRKSRKRPNRSPNRNPAASAKGSRQPRRNRAQHPLNSSARLESRSKKALPPGRALFIELPPHLGGAQLHVAHEQNRCIATGRAAY